MLYGLLNLSLTGYVVAALILTQITILSVTIYLHRHQSHRALDLHPILSHFFRFWLWLTTGMVTAQWVAIHRKHHASTDEVGDPHSPKVLGLSTVLWRGSELYRQAAADDAMLEKYAHGTPNDWIERHLYKKVPFLGITLMFLIDLVLFGLPGITMWAVQMIWIPFWAAGVINGIGHHFGYRNFESPDVSTNIVPWGLWIGGEELHNNHHTFASSAKFSLRWWEVDIGWWFIKLFSAFGLASVRKLPPKFVVDKTRLQVDIDTVRAVVQNRFDVMRRYYKSVIVPVLKAEKKAPIDKQMKALYKRSGLLFKKQKESLGARAQLKLEALLRASHALSEAYLYKQRLQNIWQMTASSQAELVEALRQWCIAAEQSGLPRLRAFAAELRGYVPVATR